MTVPSTGSVSSVLMIPLLSGLVLGALACGGGNGPTDPSISPIAARFDASGTAATPNLVSLAGTVSGDEVVVNVSLTGPTTNTDVYSFAFDLVLGNAGVVSYVSGSAEAGPAFWAPEPVEVLVSQTDNRITVGVTRLGGVSGVGIAGSDSLPVVSLRLRVLRRDLTTVTFEGSPPNAAAALDSSGDSINEISFDAVAAAISGT